MFQNHGPYKVQSSSIVSRLVLDGVELDDDFVILVDDGQDHIVEVELQSSEKPVRDPPVFRHREKPISEI